MDISHLDYVRQQRVARVLRAKQDLLATLDDVGKTLGERDTCRAMISEACDKMVAHITANA